MQRISVNLITSLWLQMCQENLKMGLLKICLTRQNISLNVHGLVDSNRTIHGSGTDKQVDVTFLGLFVCLCYIFYQSVLLLGLRGSS